jgi:hypothetical protein
VEAALDQLQRQGLVGQGGGESDDQLSVAVLGWPAVEREFGDRDAGSAEEDQGVGRVRSGQEFAQLRLA